MNNSNYISNKIRQFISESLLLDTFIDDEESLFLSGKIDPEFLLYMVPMLENKYGIVFEDDAIILENFDSVKLITETVKRLNS